MTDAAIPLPALPARSSDANKGSCGRVLVVGGSRGMAGAPCLAARSAYRGGAGLVRVAVPVSIESIVAIKLDECLVDGLESTNAGVFHATAWTALHPLCTWADVVVLGPGMTHADTVKSLVFSAINEIERPLVLDADALNVFTGDLASLAAAQRRWPGRQMLLTPHPGEMARLLKITPQQVQLERRACVLRAAQETGAVVALKGAGTLISDGVRVYTNVTGNAGLATGGTGDVLAGLAGALLGQGLPVFEAACLAVHLHGLAGDLAARRLGEWSMVAGDVLDELPNAFLAHAGLTH